MGPYCKVSCIALGYSTRIFVADLGAICDGLYTRLFLYGAIMSGVEPPGYLQKSGTKWVNFHRDGRCVADISVAVIFVGDAPNRARG